MTFPTSALLLGLIAAEPPRVDVVQTPGGGVQPQAVVDSEGAIHLVFLRGKPDASDVYYSRRKPGESSFEAPARVNTEPGSAVAIGTVRGARIAIGRGGRIHIAWNGTQGAKPANPVGGSPLLYARSDGKRSSFEPQRNLMTRTTGLDGGGSIAADGEGRVYVAWHGQAKGSVGEANRRMWVARSTDDGATFSAEEVASGRPTGACGCCGTGAFVDSGGSAYLLYRAAAGGSERGMVLLTSRDKGSSFASTDLDAWRINACPMSTASLAEGGGGVLAAWENRSQVSFARVDGEAGGRASPTSPSGPGGSRKHPSVAVNRRGEALLVWAEETAWQEGGSLAWQAFDATGREVGPRGKLAGAVPVWGLATVVARPDGGFTIVR
jgi:hypothetical protein